MGGCLTAQGRVEALYSVVRLGSDLFLLACDGGSRDDLFSSLMRFRVTEQILVEDAGLVAGIVFDATDLQIGGAAYPVVQRGEGVIFLRQSRFGEGALEFFAPAGSLGELNGKGLLGEQIGEDEFFFERVQRNVPVFPREVSDGHLLMETPQLAAVSFRKGCYVGQEVNERIDSHGRAPRITVPFAVTGGGETCPASGDPVVTQNESKRVGEVLSMGKWNEEAVGFVSLRNQPEVLQGGLRCGERTLRIIS